MKTTQSQNSTATAGGHTPTRPELTFDGIGINGPDQYRTRVTTFNGDANAQKYGPIFSQAPAMLEALKISNSLLATIHCNLIHGREALHGGKFSTFEILQALDENRAILAHD